MKVHELDFQTHPAGCGGTRAVVSFDNGYGASVVAGPLFHTTENAPYEIAVLRDGHICYDTPITDDVCGYLTSGEANKILSDIEALPKYEGK